MWASAMYPYVLLARRMLVGPFFSVFMRAEKPVHRASCHYVFLPFCCRSRESDSWTFQRRSVRTGNNREVFTAQRAGGIDAHVELQSSIDAEGVPGTSTPSVPVVSAINGGWGKSYRRSREGVSILILRTSECASASSWRSSCMRTGSLGSASGHGA